MSSQEYETETNITHFSSKEELDYVVRAKTDDEYRKLVVGNFISLVKRMASPYIKDGIIKEDLIQEGVQGLHKAIDGFDPSKNKRFATYARWWVKHYITQYYRCNIRGFKISGNISGKLAKLNGIVDDLEQLLGRAPTKEELAKEMGYDVGYINYLFKFVNNTVSLDQYMAGSQDEHGGTNSAMLVDNHADSPYERLAREDSVTRVKKCIEELSENEKKVLNYRYGLDGENPLTLQQVGDILGLTAEWVRQLQLHAEKKLRERIYV